MPRVAIIGSGVGGLCAAVRLATDGYEVDVFERNAVVGGKLGQRSFDGFTFDTGPSLLTLPHVFGEVFALANMDIDVALSLIRLDPAFQYHFADGSNFAVHDDPAMTRASVNAFAGPVDAAAWAALMQRAERAWQISERTFFAGAMDSPIALLRRMKSPFDFVGIDAWRTLSQRSAATFTDTRMQMWLNRYATYSGSSPWKAPATLECITYIEQHFGAWHIRGGVHALARALETACKNVGVTIHTTSDVTEVVEDDKAVRGVVVNDTVHACDVVLANCDAEHLYRDLVPRRKQLRQVKRAGRSSSGFAMLLAVEGTTPGLRHHNVWFSADQEREFEQIFGGSGLADEPTIYVCCSSVTDESAAPTGHENWFVLVNVGAGATTDWSAYGSRIIERLGIEARVVRREDISPQDIADRYRAPGGAIYGASSNGKRAAFLRASNRGPLRGLYLLGGSSHPGGGLPLVATSAAIASRMVKEDFT